MLFRRKVAFEEGANFAKDNNLVFMEVSAKTGYQVEESFKRNADLLLDKIEKGIIDTKNEVFSFLKLSVLESRSETQLTDPQITRLILKSYLRRSNKKRREGVVDHLRLAYHQSFIVFQILLI